MNLAQHSLIFAVRLYQWAISPLLSAISGPAGQCRFTPSCSHYAAEAVREHGAVKGGALAVWRVCRCHPWGGCGEDRVPRKVQSSRFKVQSSREAEVIGRVQGPRFKVQSSREAEDLGRVQSSRFKVQSWKKAEVTGRVQGSRFKVQSLTEPEANGLKAVAGGRG